MEDSEAQPRRTSPRKALQVAESKAKRLERQQARFRDRGGIFVPTARNTLADILLGRTTANQSPSRQARARSQSRSPIKAGASTSPTKRIAALSVQNQSRTPKKSAVPRKSTAPRAKNPPTKIAETEEVSPLPKPGKATARKSRGGSTKKRPAKVKGTQSKEEPQPDSNIAPPEKTEKPKRKAKQSASKKKASEVTESKPSETSEPAASEPLEAGTSRSGSIPRAKRSAVAGTKSKQAKVRKSARKASELEDGDDQVEGDQVKKQPPASKKRTRGKATQEDEEVDATGAGQPRKRAKTSEETTTRKKTREAEVADAQPIETNQPDEKPKRRSRKQNVSGSEYEDAETKPSGGTQRKRAKVAVVEDEPEEDTRPAKRTKTASRKAKAETSTAKKATRASKTTTQREGQASKSGKTSGRPKITGPRKSVMIRMKEPPPPIDDEPDPINFLS